MLLEKFNEKQKEPSPDCSTFSLPTTDESGVGRWGLPKSERQVYEKIVLKKKSQECILRILDSSARLQNDEAIYPNS